MAWIDGWVLSNKAIQREEFTIHLWTNQQTVITPNINVINPITVKTDNYIIVVDIDTKGENLAIKW